MAGQDWKVQTYGQGDGPLRLTALNHISRNCSSVEDSIHFYSKVLGFVQIKRPNSFDFDGAWLFNYGIGIHLLKDDNLDPNNRQLMPIEPKADHISFQCEDITAVEIGLRELNIPFKRQVVEEGGVLVDQLFFHDPDNHMIEICNCQLLPVEPLSTCTPCRLISSLSGVGLGAAAGGDEPAGLRKRPSSNHLAAAAMAVSLLSGLTPDVQKESVGEAWERSVRGGESNQPNAMYILQKSQQEERQRDEVSPCA